MTMWLRNGVLAVEVRPEKGADITSIIDEPTGTETLFQSPWGRRDLAGAPVTGDSQVDWLARYGGGWQQLVPNAGAPREVDGVRRGYHGEAAVVSWAVRTADEHHLLVETDLITAPLHLTRSLTLDGPTLRVRDTVTNTSDEPVPVMWVEHPGFGAPFIDGRCTLTSGARTVVTDAEHPGNLLPAATRAPFPVAPTADGGTVDLGVVPGPDSGRSVFACLTDFTDGWFAIDSPTAGFGLLVEWDPAVLPHAWFWQECHASPGFPWHRRAYVVAVEPANVLPGGEPPVLAPGAKWTADISVTVRRVP
jgi:galactose mutarotase-like enzyme